MWCQVDENARALHLKFSKGVLKDLLWSTIDVPSLHLFNFNAHVDIFIPPSIDLITYWKLRSDPPKKEKGFYEVARTYIPYFDQQTHLFLR
jgi:hypothetical protein